MTINLLGGLLLVGLSEKMGLLDWLGLDTAACWLDWLLPKDIWDKVK